MRFSYKPIVERFNIPRSTLIEWKKQTKIEPKNWRVKHLKYLQNQILLEAETLNELSRIGIKEEEIFIFSTCLYLCKPPLKLHQSKRNNSFLNYTSLNIQ